MEFPPLTTSSYCVTTMHRLSHILPYVLTLIYVGVALTTRPTLTLTPSPVTHPSSRSRSPSTPLSKVKRSAALERQVSGASDDFYHAQISLSPSPVDNVEDEIRPVTPAANAGQHQPQHTGKAPARGASHDVPLPQDPFHLGVRPDYLGLFKSSVKSPVSSSGGSRRTIFESLQSFASSVQARAPSLPDSHDGYLQLNPGRRPEHLEVFRNPVYRSSSSSGSSHQTSVERLRSFESRWRARPPRKLELPLGLRPLGKCAQCIHKKLESGVHSFFPLEVKDISYALEMSRPLSAENSHALWEPWYAENRAFAEKLAVMRLKCRERMRKPRPRSHVRETSRRAMRVATQRFYYNEELRYIKAFVAKEKGWLKWLKNSHYGDETWSKLYPPGHATLRMPGFPDHLERRKAMLGLIPRDVEYWESEMEALKAKIEALGTSPFRRLP